MELLVCAPYRRCYTRHDPLTISKMYAPYSPLLPPIDLASFPPYFINFPGGLIFSLVGRADITIGGAWLLL